MAQMTRATSVFSVCVCACDPEECPVNDLDYVHAHVAAAASEKSLVVNGRRGLRLLLSLIASCVDSHYCLSYSCEDSS